MVRLRHFDNLGTARFVTFSCYHRYRLLRSEDSIGPFLEELESARRAHRFHVLGYVVMPDHVHLVIYPHGKLAVGRVIGEIKRRSAFRIISSWKEQNQPILGRVEVSRSGKTGHAFWQPRGYDHNCRTPETVREKINYCHMNPVRARLVAEPRDWPWSSYRWYIGDRQGPVYIDEIELLCEVT